MSAAHVTHLLRPQFVWSALCIVLGTLPAAAMPDAAPAAPGSAVPVTPVQADGSGVALDQEPAPELFEATGTAMWDGRRTLQGVWVAHPLADSARRARIYNTETGAAVDGALMTRDSSVGGHPVLISSQAAQALGMMPGDEVSIRIVALTPSQRPQPSPAADASAPSQSRQPIPPVDLEAPDSEVVAPSQSEGEDAGNPNTAQRRGLFRRPPSDGLWARPPPAPPAATTSEPASDTPVPARRGPVFVPAPER